MLLLLKSMQLLSLSRLNKVSIQREYLHKNPVQVVEINLSLPKTYHCQPHSECLVSFPVWLSAFLDSPVETSVQFCAPFSVFLDLIIYFHLLMSNFLISLYSLEFHLYFSFVHVDRYVYGFIPLHVDIQLCHQHLLKMLSLFHCIISASLSKVS